MKKHWRELEPDLLIEPLLHRQGYFFNPPGRWTGRRVAGRWTFTRYAERVDSVLYMRGTVECGEPRADAMALSVEVRYAQCELRNPFTASVSGPSIMAIFTAWWRRQAMATLLANGAERISHLRLQRPGRWRRDVPDG